MLPTEKVITKAATLLATNSRAARWQVSVLVEGNEWCSVRPPASGQLVFIMACTASACRQCTGCRGFGLHEARSSRNENFSRWGSYSSANSAAPVGIRLPVFQHWGGWEEASNTDRVRDRDPLDYVPPPPTDREFDLVPQVTPDRSNNLLRAVDVDADADADVPNWGWSHLPEDGHG